MNIVLKKIEKKDLKYLYAWRCNSEVDKFMFQSKPENYEKHVEWYKNTINNNSRIDFIIIVDDVPIGYYGITNINQIDNSCECGFYIGNINYRGKGIFSFTQINIISFIFDKLKYNLIKLAAFSYNPACYIYEKLGFKLIKVNIDISYFELSFSNRPDYDFSNYKNMSFSILNNDEIIRIYKKS